MTTLTETINKLITEVDRKGWNLHSIKQNSETLVYCTVLTGKNEYVSYLFNSEDVAFYSGQYFTDIEDALDYTRER